MPGLKAHTPTPGFFFNVAPRGHTQVARLAQQVLLPAPSRACLLPKYLPQRQACSYSLPFFFFFDDFSSCFTISDPASNNSLGWGSIGQLVESLFSTHKILDSSPCTSGTVCGACVLAIQALRRWMWGGIGGGGLGDQEFRVLLGYILGLKPAWATRYPISKKCK